MSKLIFTLSDISFSMTKNWFIDIFRALFAFLDFIVYFVIELLFRAVFNLSNFELYGMYEEIMDRVYVILGIFMLFKVTISLITYLVNPDKINDKEQGVGKLTSRVITVLIMLIGLPTFFSLMTEAQNKLLPVVPRVIIGTANKLSSEDVSGISSNMALTMIQGFAHVKDGCSNTPVENLSGFLAHINDSCESSEGSTQGNSKAYAYDYLPIISTITGVIMIYVVFSLCLSVTIRAFKLIILRSIAPIPVLSYIDPKSSKDGPFAAWTKTFFSTWAELFINLGIIYFIVYIIDYMLSGDAYKQFFTKGMLAIDGVFFLAFIIIGLLMFAKQAPKFTLDALGIKSKGNFARMLGMGATAIGMGGNVASQFAARQAKNPGHGLGHGLANFGASLFGGAMNGINAGSALLGSDKASVLAGVNELRNRQEKALDRIDVNSGLGGGITSLGRSIITGETGIHKKENEWKQRENAIKAREDQLKVDEAKNKALTAQNSYIEAMISRAESKGLTSLETSGEIEYNGVTYRGNAFKLNAAWEDAKAGNGIKTDTNGETYFEFEGQQIYTKDAGVITYRIGEANKADWYEGHLDGRYDDDSVMTSNAQLLRDSGGTVAMTLGDAKDASGKNKTTISINQRNINETNESISNDRRTLNEEKNSDDIVRMKENDNYFNPSSGKK